MYSDKIADFFQFQPYLEPILRGTALDFRSDLLH